MAELNTLARPYAKAAFEFAQSQQQLTQWSAALGLLAAEVTSAFALSEEQQDKLAKALSARLGRHVRLNASEDASLIGGVVIRAGDLVIDGSVRGKLAQLAEALKP